MPATTEFNWALPDIGSDDNTWGDILNATLQSIEDKIVSMRIPVGGLYLSTSSANPATALGYGTWAAHATGRAIVGVGNNGEHDWSVNEQRGDERITLSANQIPSHSHSFSATTNNSGNHNHGGTTSSSGNHTHPVYGAGLFYGGYSSGPAQVVGSGSGNSYFPMNPQGIQSAGSHSHNFTTDQSGNHNHSVSGTTGSAGSGHSHSNVQPSIAVYVWRRTA